MKVVIESKVFDIPVLVINNERNEIMISEAPDGSFMVTCEVEGDEVVIAHVK